MDEINAILDALKAVRIPAVPTEEALHACVINALNDKNLPWKHEVSLGAGRRIDIVCGRVGIEIKKGRPAARPLLRQLTRYASSHELDALLCLVEKSVFLPARVAGKPLHTISLNRLWGVSLP